MITISHTHADGTLIDGSSKGDGVYDLLRGLRDNWRYFRSIGQIGLGLSRDKAADRYKIKRAADALRAAGHDVTVEIDESDRRAFADVEADRYGRADERAERFADRAAAATANGERMWGETSQVYEALNGQPILVGHHSEQRHRNLLDKTRAKERRAVAEIRRGSYWADRAKSAEGLRDSRESVPTTLRRIEKLEAEQRKLQRRLDGTDPYSGHGEPASGDYREQLTARVEDIAEEVAYWRQHVAARAEAGVKVWSRDDFAKGDFVQFLGKWFEVLRVNGKSLTIPAMCNDGKVIRRDGARLSWTDTVPYHEVTGRKSGADMAAILADADRLLELAN